MTTSVIVRPAGHHVRVTQTPVGLVGCEPAVFELEPATAERTFYVHNQMTVTVEEFAPATETI